MHHSRSWQIQNKYRWSVTACVVYTADSIRKFDSKSNRTADSIRDLIRTQKNDSQVPKLSSCCNYPWMDNPQFYIRCNNVTPMMLYELDWLSLACGNTPKWQSFKNKISIWCGWGEVIPPDTNIFLKSDVEGLFACLTPNHYIHHSAGYFQRYGRGRKQVFRGPSK